MGQAENTVHLTSVDVLKIRRLLLRIDTETSGSRRRLKVLNCTRQIRLALTRAEARAPR